MGCLCCCANSNTAHETIISLGSEFMGEPDEQESTTGEEIKELPKTLVRIGRSSLRDRRISEKFLLPPLLRFIGDFAFTQSSIATLNIPDHVVSLGERAFADCLRLRSVSSDTPRKPPRLPPRGVGIREMNYLSDGPGETCPALEMIGDACFINCSQLVMVHLEGSMMKSIGDFAFSSCHLLEDFSVDSHSITSIGAYCFDGCFRLKHLSLPASLTSVGRGAFRGCDSLRPLNSAIIPVSVTQFSLWFSENTYPANFQLPNDRIWTSVASDAFRECEWLTSLELPESIREIGDYAFHNCIHLSTFILPSLRVSQLRYIGRSAFRGVPHRTKDGVMDFLEAMLLQNEMSGELVLH